MLFRSPSAIAARGGKFRQLPGEPGNVTVSLSRHISCGACPDVHMQPTALDDPWVLVEQFRHAAKMAKEAGFDGVECAYTTRYSQ